MAAHLDLIGAHGRELAQHPVLGHHNYWVSLGGTRVLAAMLSACRPLVRIA